MKNMRLTYENEIIDAEVGIPLKDALKVQMENSGIEEIIAAPLSLVFACVLSCIFVVIVFFCHFSCSVYNNILL